MSHSQKLQFYLKEEFFKAEICIFLGITAHLVLEVLNKSDKRVGHKKASNEQNTLLFVGAMWSAEHCNIHKGQANRRFIHTISDTGKETACSNHSGILYLKYLYSTKTKFNLESKNIISPTALQKDHTNRQHFSHCEITYAKHSHLAATFCEQSRSPA